MTVRRYKSCRMLIHDRQKVRMEEHGNSRNLYGTIISGNEKIGHNVSFDDVSAKHKEVHIKIKKHDIYCGSR